MIKTRVLACSMVSRSPKMAQRRRGSIVSTLPLKLADSMSGCFGVSRKMSAFVVLEMRSSWLRTAPLTVCEAWSKMSLWSMSTKDERYAKKSAHVRHVTDASIIFAATSLPEKWASS